MVLRPAPSQAFPRQKAVPAGGKLASELPFRDLDMAPELIPKIHSQEVRLVAKQALDFLQAELVRQRHTREDEVPQKRGMGFDE